MLISRTFGGWCATWSTWTYPLNSYRRAQCGRPAGPTGSEASFRAALDMGIAELDAGLGVETTPDELMAEVSAEVGFEP